MNIVVTGSRTWTDETTIRLWLAHICGRSVDVAKRTRLAHGAAKGADLIADAIAREFEFIVQQYPADWSLGKGAGPIRNGKMLRAEKPDRVIAFSFVENNDKVLTAGTHNCVKYALTMGISVTIVPPGAKP